MKEAFDLIRTKLRAKKDNVAHNLQLFREHGNERQVSFCETKLDTYVDALSIVYEVEAEYGNGWIPVEKALPEDCDNRFYMCIVENHEEDLPMYCQYEEDYGFEFWLDYYDEHTLGFVDSEFKTNEELGYEKVIAWMQIPKYTPTTD